MIDINKSRNNFKKFPTLKQKCDPVIKVQSTNNSINSNNSCSGNTKVTVITTTGTAGTTTTTAIATTKTTATTNHKIQTNEPTKTHVKDIQARLTNLSRSLPSSSSSAVANATNAVRAANQHFFLIPAFKDQNFLKAECELAHAQVAVPQASARGERHGQPAGEDTCNNNNHIHNNNNNSIGNNNRIYQQLPRLATLTSNGMRRSGGGNGSHLGSTAATTTTTTTTAATVPSASAGATHKVDIVFNQFKALPKTPKPSVFAAPAAATVTKIGGRQLVRPLVHRTIPATAVAAANTVATGVHTPDVSHISYTNKVNNNNNNNNSKISCIHQNSISSGNNNMHQQLPCRRDDAAIEQDHDDIKYIDSDDATAPAERKAVQVHYMHGTLTGSTSLAKARVRPKSTIICSSSNSTASASNNSQHVFEKVNNYKYTNGDSSAVTRRHEIRPSGIDSSSIKASIEKFNSFSEQKRLPLSCVTLRSQRDGGSGSTSNLQHHRHSSDFDNCNLRLPNSSGGSLTRSPYRSLLTSGAAAASVAVAPSAKVVTTSMHSTPAAYSSAPPASRLASLSSSSASSTNSLPTKTGGACSRHHDGVLSRSTERVSVSSLLAVKDTITNTSPPTTYKTTSGSTKLQQQDAVVSGDAKKHATAEGGNCAANADSIRSATTRSVLPPASPSSSRYWDRESSRTSSLSSSTYNHTDDVNKSASDEKSEGLCGLRNIGNTCFMNSVIQCLSHTSELTKFLKTQNGLRSTSSKDQLILQEFAKLIREMWTNNVHTVTPMELKRAFSTKHRMYSDYNQQDAQEFLRFFLDSLHSALNTGVKGDHLKIDDNLSDNKKADLTWEWYTRHENSLIRDLFVGQLKSTLKCTVCGNTSVTFDPFWDLSVSLPSSNRCKLDSCLDLFIREEILDGDEMPTCSRCKTRRKCTKSFSIQRFPKYLVIHLKRFSETRWSKLSNIVEFPTGERELNMGPYGSNHNTNIYYSLYAISNHMGSTAGGHYVALCKHPVSKKWHEFNDNIVSDALSENHLVSSSAYILFYERA